MQKNYNENLVAGAAIRDDKGRRISKLFEASHPKMTVGYAKNLIMPDDPTEQEFNFRQSGGGVIEDGVAVIDKVKGNSVVWNQLADALTSSKWSNRQNNVTYLNNVLTYNEVQEINYAENYPIENLAYFKSGHKYLCTLVVTNVNNGTIRVGESDTSYFFNVSTIGFHYGFLVATTNDMLRYVTGGTSISVKDIFVYDLTQMFGAGNEPSTYEEFLSRKPKIADEYAYNEGTIVNTKVEAIKTSGVNLWDEQWEQGSLDAQGLPAKTTASIRSKEFNRCLPNCEICFSCQSAAAKLIYWYDVNKAFISRNEVSNSASIYGVATSPANAYFFKVRNDKSTYNHDICINLSDPSINGQYFPYEKHELDLAWIKDIKDTEGVKLFEDGMAKGDFVTATHASKGSCKRILTGNESWTDFISNYHCVALNFESPNYYIRPDSFGISNKVTMPIKPANLAGNGIQFGNSNEHFESYFTTLQEWKDYLASQYSSGNPVEVYYELAEPIEVEYDEKNLTYPVVAGGTEEAIVSEPSSAFRADIGYGIDAVKTILDLKARVAALEGK